MRLPAWFSSVIMSAGVSIPAVFVPISTSMMLRSGLN
jgi:hypothetical protein